VICWPGVTDDVVCGLFAKGFYEFFENHNDDDDDWISDCFESAILKLATKRIKLTPALVRGDANPDVACIEPPQLLDAHTKAIEVGLQSTVSEREEQEETKEAVEELEGKRQQANGAVVMVQATASGREHFNHLHDIIEDVFVKYQSESGGLSFELGNGDMQWCIRFAGDMQTLVQDGSVMENFVRELQFLCGTGADITRLTSGSIVAHITSPIANYRRVRAAVEAGSCSTHVGGLEATGVELGDWITIDTEAWSQLDEEGTRQLEERFAQCGLQHLLTVLMAVPTQEALLKVKTAEAAIPTVANLLPHGVNQIPSWQSLENSRRELAAAAIAAPAPEPVPEVKPGQTEKQPIMLSVRCESTSTTDQGGVLYHVRATENENGSASSLENLLCLRFSEMYEFAASLKSIQGATIPPFPSKYIKLNRLQKLDTFFREVSANPSDKVQRALENYLKKSLAASEARQGSGISSSAGSGLRHGKEDGKVEKLLTPGRAQKNKLDQLCLKQPVDNNISLSQYYKTSQQLRVKASELIGQQNWNESYVFLKRFARICLYTIPAHKHYNEPLFAEQKQWSIAAAKACLTEIQTAGEHIEAAELAAAAIAAPAPEPVPEVKPDQTEKQPIMLSVRCQSTTQFFVGAETIDPPWKLRGALKIDSPAELQLLEEAAETTDDMRLLQFLQLEGNAAAGAAADGTVAATGWDKLSCVSRVQKLKAASVSFRVALLGHLLGVRERSDVSPSAPASLDAVPLPLRIAVVALRLWALEARRANNPLSDAELHAALSGIVCALEPGLASLPDEVSLEDPFERIERIRQYQQWLEQMKQDGVDECAEVQPTREGVTILKEKWPTEDSDGSVQYWQIKGKQLLALEKEATYNVTPHSRRIVGTAVIAATNGCNGSSQAPGTTKFLGEQLEIVHFKPQWITMKGLQRLEEWTLALKEVHSLVHVLQLPSPLEQLVDSTDFLFVHWCVEAGHADPARISISRRCSDALGSGTGSGASGSSSGKDSSIRLLKLFDTLLDPVRGSVRVSEALDNEHHRCPDEVSWSDLGLEMPTTSADTDSDSVCSDWDADSDDGGDEHGDAAADDESPFSAVVSAIVQSTNDDDDCVAEAGIRLLTMLPRAEVQRVAQALRTIAAVAADDAARANRTAALKRLLEFAQRPEAPGATLSEEVSSKLWQEGRDHEAWSEERKRTQLQPDPLCASVGTLALDDGM
jgi:hypothetical protein